MTNMNQDEVNKPALSYWHVWTDGEGVSHQTRVELTSFKEESMGSGASPQWNNHILTSAAHVLFSEMPVGWIGLWHENPKPQWIIPLSGRWFVERMDGKRVEMGVGDVSFGADQNTKSDEKGHNGHVSGTIGQQPVMLMIVQLIDDKWIGAKPGDLS